VTVAPGSVFVSKGWEFDRDIPRVDRQPILDRIMRLPAWVAGDESAANLNVDRLEGLPGFFRLRIGAFRAIFQRLGPHVILHRVEGRGAVYADHRLRSLRFVRDRDGLRLLAPPPALVAAERADTPHRPPPKASIQRREQQNPLTPFTDAELEQLGLSPAAITELRLVPAEMPPDPPLMRLGVDAQVVAAVVELWRDPAPHAQRLAAGEPLSLATLLLSEEEAAERAESRDSASALVAVANAEALDALLELPIEDWMVFLHPAQQRLVDLSNDAPARVRGGAGTGKTVVALHRARALAEQRRGRVLLTTFVTTLPRVWQGLFATFAPAARAALDIRTVDAVAYEIYREGGGWAEPADSSWIEGVVRDVHGGDAEPIGGLTSIGLADEFDYVLTGRGVADLEAYLALPRTGRGSPLGRAARKEVWRRYERYREHLDDAARYGFHEIRAEALRMVVAGEVHRRYAAVVADETQDLTETSVRLLAALAGGGPRPAVTFVGDGQQAIYPGGFSLRSLGVDVRGRSFILRANWRNTYAIWLAASAFIGGDVFDDLEESDSQRTPQEQPYPLRDGASPRLHELSSDAEAAEWLAALVAEDLERGADPADCAVLAPTNAIAAHAERALTLSGLPVRRLDQYAGEHGSAVWCGTFHRAKGLEFKRVYIAGLSEARWPPRVPGLDVAAQREADERSTRAAFVAMTRARDMLDVVVARPPAPRLADAAWAFER
jgi:hypothetical protein